MHDPGDACLNQLDRFHAADSGGNNEDPAFEAKLLRGLDKLQAALASEIDIEQDNGDAAREQGKRFEAGMALADDLEISFLFEGSGQTFPEHLVIVYQSDA